MKLKTIFAALEVYKLFWQNLPKTIFTHLSLRSPKPMVYLSTKIILSQLSYYRHLLRQTSRYDLYETQLLGSLYLYTGQILNMQTGEGKTLTAVLPLLLHAEMNQSTHMLTTNDYLAKRDFNWFTEIIKVLPFTTGLILTSTSLKGRYTQYLKNITYLNNTEVGFDFLRELIQLSPGGVRLPSFYFGLVDEVDSVLLDSANTPMLLSSAIYSQHKSNSLTEIVIDELVKFFRFRQDFLVDLTTKGVFVTNCGLRFIAAFLNLSHLPSFKTLLRQIIEFVPFLINSLRARLFFKRLKDYLILNKGLQIIDKLTGRVLPGRRWNKGLHQALESKECLKINPETMTLATITYQNLYNLYPILSGMTGTTSGTYKEFREIFGLEIKQLPNFRASFRTYSQTQILQSELTKWRLVAVSTKLQSLQCGIPTLIITPTIDKSDLVSELFLYNRLPHQLLNAKPGYARYEQKILNIAGRKASVTLSTRMLSRGIDINLGGEAAYMLNREKSYLTNTYQPNNIALIIFWKNYKLKALSKAGFQNLLLRSSIQLWKKSPLPKLPRFYYERYAAIRFTLLFNKFYLYKLLQEVELQALLKSKGLFVLNTEISETKRIDDQIAGRGARQGAPGLYQLFLSLDDYFIKENISSKLQELFHFTRGRQPIYLNESAFSSAQMYISSTNAFTRQQKFNWQINYNNYVKDQLTAFTALEQIPFPFCVNLSRENTNYQGNVSKLFVRDPSQNVFWTRRKFWIQYVIFTLYRINWETTHFLRYLDIKKLKQYWKTLADYFLILYDQFVESNFIYQFKSQELLLLLVEYLHFWHLFLNDLYRQYALLIWKDFHLLD
uniref:Preprotein translocase subunit SecA n=1 Tax=Chromera velia TaxID=505693 RepID=D9IXE6_9ALVE|nr:preprotein translocase subunit SecA [Chromera velia]ADJ66554.1 preprotein translocase subunit SecA [Chromera velia]